MPKLLALAKNGLNYQEKVSFLLILIKSVEPIFQSAGPISRHTALEETLPGRSSRLSPGMTLSARKFTVSYRH